MFKLYKTPSGTQEIIETTISQYGVASSYGLFTQNVYYDNLTEFVATLSAQTSIDHFISLSFSYHSKTNNDDHFILNLAAISDGKLNVSCSKNLERQDYIIADCQDKISMLKANIIEVINHCKKTDNHIDKNFLHVRSKDLLEKFAKIARVILRSDVHNDYALDMVNNTLKLEAEIFKNVLEIEVPPSRCATI